MPTLAPPRPKKPAAPHLDRAYAVLATPVGELTLVATPRGLAEIHLEPVAVPSGVTPSPATRAHLERSRAAVLAYFAGNRDAFRGLPLDARPAPPFHDKVYAALAEIGFGETIGYGELARRAGSPGAARAVGQAMAKNPLPLVQPCHRVLASGGKLGGFGGGLGMKEALLRFEGALPRA